MFQTFVWVRTELFGCKNTGFPEQMPFLTLKIHVKGGNGKGVKSKLKHVKTEPYTCRLWTRHGDAKSDLGKRCPVPCQWFPSLGCRRSWPHAEYACLVVLSVFIRLSNREKANTLKFQSVLTYAGTLVIRGLNHCLKSQK